MFVRLVDDDGLDDIVLELELVYIGAFCGELVIVDNLVLKVDFSRLVLALFGLVVHHFVKNLALEIIENDIVERCQSFCDVDRHVDEDAFEDAEFDLGLVVDIQLGVDVVGVELAVLL